MEKSRWMPGKINFIYLPLSEAGYPNKEAKF